MHIYWETLLYPGDNSLLALHITVMLNSNRVVPASRAGGLFTLVVQGASGVFLSALKPPMRVLDSTHLDHIARQHWVDRHAP